MKLPFLSHVLLSWLVCMCVVGHVYFALCAVAFSSVRSIVAGLWHLSEIFGRNHSGRRSVAQPIWCRNQRVSIECNYTQKVPCIRRQLSTFPSTTVCCQISAGHIDHGFNCPALKLIECFRIASPPMHRLSIPFGPAPASEVMR